MPGCKWLVFVVLALAGALGGCGRSSPVKEKEVEAEPEYRLVKQWLAVLDGMAAAYDKVTDVKSMAQSRRTIKDLSDELSKISQEFQTLDTDKKEAAMNIHGGELEQAVERMRAAKERAVKLSSK